MQVLQSYISFFHAPVISQLCSAKKHLRTQAPGSDRALSQRPHLPFATWPSRPTHQGGGVSPHPGFQAGRVTVMRG